MTNEQAAKPDNTPRCDHVCLKDDAHNERGERHFYGYENPSVRLLDQMRSDIIRVARHVRSHDDRPFEEADRILTLLGEPIF